MVKRDYVAVFEYDGRTEEFGYESAYRANSKKNMYDARIAMIKEFGKTVFYRSRIVRTYLMPSGWYRF